MRLFVNQLEYAITTRVIIIRDCSNAQNKILAPSTYALFKSN